MARDVRVPTTHSVLKWPTAADAARDLAASRRCGYEKDISGRTAVARSPTWSVSLISDLAAPFRM
jgi:hypothetical protein